MESNNELGSGMFSVIGSSFLGLDHNNNNNNNNNPSQQQQNLQHRNQPKMVQFGSSSSSSHHQQINYDNNNNSSKNKHQQGSLSDEDEQGFNNIDVDESNSNKMKNISSSISPWQRMKWTSTMVRLLIMAVYYIGDEVGGGGGSSGGGSSENKKGKWKSVSRAMMEKGFYVSPQQCEDKFNDLNKRYKRVNDVLGRVTACKVVENQKLLETMDHLSPKAKEEVRKLLNSKHLFFREMCAYHNSFGHGGDNASQSQLQHEQGEKEKEERCFHSSSKLKIGCEEEDHNDDSGDDDDDDDSENYFDEDEDELGEGGSKGHHDHHHDHNKRQKKSSSCELMKELSNEVNGVLEDKGKSVLEKKQWLRSKIVKLEEKQIRHEGQGFEIEKERMKWRKYSSKKEREMERAKFENQRRRLEIERMILIIHQKELELQHQQHQ
ncbi:hypothetical protein S83_006000 [Arachis hypogaea]